MEKWKTGTRESGIPLPDTTMGKAIQLCASRLFPNRVCTTPFQRHI